MRESRGPFRFFVWYTVILRSAGPAVLTILLVYGVMHSLFLPYFRSNITNLYYNCFRFISGGCF